MMQRSKSTLLCSAFHTRAELHGSLSDARNAMKSIPNVKLISTGTRVRYAIHETIDKEYVGATIELTSKDVTFTFYPKEPNATEYKHNLLRFMSVLAYLKDLYTVSMGDMYCYVIEALRHDDYTMSREAGNMADSSNGRMDALNGVNVSLSHELSLRSASMKAMSRKLAAYRSFSEEVIQKLTLRSGSVPSDSSEVLDAMGIDKNLATEIISLIGEKATNTITKGDKID